MAKMIGFKKRQRSSGTTSPSSKGGIVIEDLSEQIIPVTGTNRFAIIIHNLLAPDECANLIRRAEDEGFDDALIQGPDGKQILRQDIRSCGRCIIDDAALADAIYVRILNAIRGTEHEKKLLNAPWVSQRQGDSSSPTSFRSQSTSAAAGPRNSSPSDDVDYLDSSVASARGRLEGNSRGSAAAGSIRAVGLNERMRFLKYSNGHFFGPHQDIRYTRGPDAGDRAGETSYITVQLYLNDKFKGGATRFLSGKRFHDVKPRVGSALVFDHDLLHEGSVVTGGTKFSVRTDIMFTAPPTRRRSSSVERERERNDPLGIFGDLP